MDQDILTVGSEYLNSQIRSRTQIGNNWRVPHQTVNIDISKERGYLFGRCPQTVSTERGESKRWTI